MEQIEHKEPQNHILKVNKNIKGRDFFTTDVHGCFDLLVEAMRENNFSPANGDRLFSSGDWTDRGPKSKEVLDWLNEPWVFSSRGNHEEMVISYIESLASGDERDCMLPFQMLFFNGGQWFFEISEKEQMRIYESFKSLPLAIELESRSGRKIGIVHAEVPSNDWEQFANMTKTELKWNGEAVAQWARTRYDKQNLSLVENIDEVYVGHTPTKSGKVEQLGNVFYADAGSFIRDKISFLEIL